MNKCIFLVFLLSLFCGSPSGIFAQEKTAKFSSYAKRGSDYESYLSQARKYIIKDPDKAYSYVEKALTICIKEQNLNGEADCYSIIGEINLGIQQFDLAISNFNKALSRYQQTAEKEKIIAVQKMLAKAYQENKNYGQTEKNLSIVLNESNDENEILDIQSKRAENFIKQGDLDKAGLEYDKAKTIQMDSSNRKAVLKANKTVGDAYLNSTEKKKALKYFTENERIASSVKDTFYLKDALNKQAEVYSVVGNKKSELAIRERSLALNTLSKDSAGQANENLNIGKIYLEQKQLDNAIDYLEKSIGFSEKSDLLELKGKGLQSLSKAYDIIGDHNKALLIYKMYVANVNKLQQEKEEKILQNLSLMGNLTNRLQRIDMLENEKALSDRTISLQHDELSFKTKSLEQQRILIYLLIAVLILLAIAFFLIYKSAKQKRIANQLLALRSLRSQMNPHFIFNALNSVNNYISKNDERSANKYLSNFSQLMRSVMENSKFDFVALSSEVKIVELYLKLEHSRFNDKFDYQFEIDENIDSDAIEIPPMLIQPYIENAIWHGLRYKEEKGNLNVKISAEKGCLKICITDDGIGRSTSQEIKTKNQKELNSTGLKNINNRVAILNEVHNINLKVMIEDLDPVTKRGTRVIIEFTHPSK